MTIFNYLTNNDLVFYGIFAGTAVFMGYSLCKSIWLGSESDFDSLNTDLGTSSNVYSDVGTQTEDPSSSVGTTNSSQFLFPVHEAKYRELLALLSTDMQKRGIDELCLRLMIYKYPVEDLNSINFNRKIIIRFCVHFFFKNFDKFNMFNL
nr:hypothetical protein [Lactarius zonarius]